MQRSVAAAAQIPAAWCCQSQPTNGIWLGCSGTCSRFRCPTLGGRAHLTSLRARRRSPAV